MAEITMPSRVRSRAGREERRTSETDQGVIVDGHADLWVKLAKCCAPVPGDPIVGFITRGSGISVHHETCTNAIQLQDQQPDRMVEVSWSGRHSAAYLVHIKIEALDRPRLLTDIALVISEQQVNLHSASAQSNSDRLATSFFSFELADPSHLQSVLSHVRRIEGVYDVYRVTADGKPVGVTAPALDRLTAQDLLPPLAGGLHPGVAVHPVEAVADVVDLDVAAADESPQQGRGHRCRAEPEQVHGRAHRDGDGGAADRLDLIGSQPRGAQHDAGDLAPMG